MSDPCIYCRHRRATGDIHSCNRPLPGRALLCRQAYPGSVAAYKIWYNDRTVEGRDAA